jgi:hypothetical protein
MSPGTHRSAVAPAKPGVRIAGRVGDQDVRRSVAHCGVGRDVVGKAVRRGTHPGIVGRAADGDTIGNPGRCGQEVGDRAGHAGPHREARRQAGRLLPGRGW